MSTLELDGEAMPASSYSGAQIAITGEAFRTTAMGAEYAGRVAVNPKANPATFDLLFETGPEAGNRNLGIYRLDGDTWTICLATIGTVRPSEFRTRPGSGFALETLRRGEVKAEAEPQKPETPAAGSLEAVGDAPEIEGEWIMTACALNGTRLPDEYAKYGKRVAKANELKVTMNGQVMVRARFTVDRTTEPMSMDYLLLQGPCKGQVQKGIYRLDGDTLETIFASPEAERPRDFQPSKGSTWTKWKKA